MKKIILEKTIIIYIKILVFLLFIFEKYFEVLDHIFVISFKLNLYAFLHF